MKNNKISKECKIGSEKFNFRKSKVPMWLGRIFSHLIDFWVVWVILLGMPILSYTVHAPAIWIKILEITFVAYVFLINPMGAVYGLVGASSNIKVFLLNFIFITVLFSLVYYGLFFRNAGVCFDKDNLQVKYALFDNNTNIDMLPIIDTTKTLIYEERITDSAIIYDHFIQKRVDTLIFHRVTLGLVIENSLMTSLTQSPSDFFYIASDFGEVLNTASADKVKTKLFSVTLLIHVLISWIFLGVFISLLYSKFRYEA